MWNKKLKLNPNLTKISELKKRATRDGFGEGLIIAGENNENVVAVCADLTESTRMENFKNIFPHRFIQLGVSEQLLVTLGVGLSMAKKIPFVASYAIFCPGRAWEQIRTNVCLNNANVKIIGSHAGVTVGADGASHQALEDIAITRVLPNMTVVVPCDAEQAKKATEQIANYDGPVYLRLEREKSPVFTTEKTPFSIGEAQIIREGTDVAIIGCGSVIYEAILAAEELVNQGIQCTIINNHTIKPLDEKTILNSVNKCGAVVTIEEHQIAGGLGSTVAELIAKNNPVPIEFIGVNDQFGQSGSPAELLEHYELKKKNIIDAVLKVIKRK